MQEDKPQAIQQQILVPSKKIAKDKQKSGHITYALLSSTDNSIQTSQILLELKNIFSRQLPKMPIEYITRLVLDQRHECLVMIQNQDQVIGGLCFRMFKQQGLVQIVFLAVEGKRQVKGHGTRLMYQMKNLMQIRKINYMMTYADNLALGYFRKQGFQDEITIPNQVWKGYIKDYEGGTIMQYIIYPQLDYLNLQQQAQQFVTFMETRILESSVKKYCIDEQEMQILQENKYIHKFSDNKQEILPFDPMLLPGLKQAGFTLQQLEELKKEPEFNIFDKCTELTNEIYGCYEAWPFREPVSKDFTQYYKEIREPMDLGTLLKKLKKKSYQNGLQYLQDLKRVFSNAKKFNKPQTPYYKNAQKLQQMFQTKLIDIQNLSYRQIQRKKQTK